MSVDPSRPPAARWSPSTWASPGRLRSPALRDGAPRRRRTTPASLEQEARRLLHQTVAGHPRAIEDRSRSSGSEWSQAPSACEGEAGLDDALVPAQVDHPARPARSAPSEHLVIVGVTSLLHTEGWRHSRPVERLALSAPLGSGQSVACSSTTSASSSRGMVDARRLPLWAALCGSAASPERRPPQGLRTCSRPPAPHG